MELVAVATVQSSLIDPASAPKQGREGAPAAWLAFDAAFAGGLDGIRVGDELELLTWLDRAARDVLRVHPRGNPANPQHGGLGTPSPARPKPNGLPPLRA